MAPLVIKDKVIVGVGGGEYGIRGFVAAYDAQDRQRSLALLHHSRPGRARTRDLAAATTGSTAAASVWITGSYDPELNLTYWGVGNPGPGLESRPAPRRQPLLRLASSRSTPTPAS